MSIVNCSICGQPMEIDTANSHEYIREEDGALHHVGKCPATETEPLGEESGQEE